MDTQLHKKIKSMCRFTRDGEGHWILQGSRTVWVPDVQEIVTTKRAAYAAFRAEIPEGMDVRADCGTFGCIAPDHAVLCPSRRIARALSLPEQIASLASPNTFSPPPPPGTLPKGLTIQSISRVKQLFADGNTIAKVRAATNLTTQEIVRIRGGVYDEAVANLEKSVDRARKTRSKTASEVIGEGAARGEEVADGREIESELVEDCEEEISEEIAWLKQMMAR